MSEPKITPIPQSMIARVAQGVRYMISGVAPGDWMSPNQPLQPMAPSDVKGRAWDYPVGWNLNQTPRGTESVSFSDLRALADNCDILRTVIETRKDQVESLGWQIKPRIENKGGDTDPRIKPLLAFFQSPDREHDWNAWLRMWLEELFVTDAPCIYRRPNRGGGLYCLELIDGTTIKPLIDSTGRRPIAPDPAYQQILKGIVAADYSADELIYAARNLRVHKVYGFSPVEQIIATVNIAIRRATHQLEYYKSGNMPDSIIGTPEEWTADQVASFQKYWDGLLSGNSANRRKGRFVPGKLDVMPMIEPPLKDMYDEWLARVICFTFSIPPTPFIKEMNRATAQTSQSTSEQEGLAPVKNYIKRYIDRILTEDFDAPDLEFAWQDMREQDPVVLAKVQDTKIKNGVLTVNEARAQDGNDPYDGVGDIPGFVTATGFVALPTEEQLAAKDEAARLAAESANAPASDDGKGGVAKLHGKKQHSHQYP